MAPWAVLVLDFGQQQRSTSLGIPRSCLGAAELFLDLGEVLPRQWSPTVLFVQAVSAVPDAQTAFWQCPVTLCLAAAAFVACLLTKAERDGRGWVK